MHQTRIINSYCTQGMGKGHHQKREPVDDLGWKKIVKKKNSSIFFTECASDHNYNVVGSSFQMLSAATEKAYRIRPNKRTCSNNRTPPLFFFFFF